MKKKYLMNSMGVLALGLMMGSCSKEVELNATDYTANAEKALGVTIDPNQNWKTTVNTDINVSVNLDYGADYTVYISVKEPLLNGQVNFIGRATITSGQTVTMTVARPIAAAILYASCYDKNNHAICKSFPVKMSGTSVSFGENTTSNAARRAASTGNRWSVTTQAMPDLSDYTMGNLIEMDKSYNTNGTTVVNQGDGSPVNLKISNVYNGTIARIQSYAGQSVYVTGTWGINEEQRVTGGSVVVVGPTGTINIGSKGKLVTNANNEAGTTGMIYVMPGGKITGEGTLEFANGTETFAHNAGTIDVANININGGVLYNSGTIGSESGTKPALIGGAGTEEAPSKLINMGTAYLSKVSGAGMSVENACSMYVTGLLQLGKSSKMDDGSYIECGSLELAGSNNGGIVLYMGNAAYMHCKGDFKVNNFGVWGPIGSTINRAIFKINDCSYVNTTENKEGTTYMLDNVELIVPSGWTTTEAINQAYGANGQAIGWLNTNHAGYRQAQLIYQYFNGQQCYGIDSNNYEWHDAVKASDGDPNVNGGWYEVSPGGLYAKSTGKFYASDVTKSRATCIYGTSPSYSVEKDEKGCGGGFVSVPDITPTPTIYTFAFEDTFMGDYDMNDVVLRVWEDADDATKVHVKLMATGAGMDLYVGYNRDLIFGGSEVHNLLGGSRGKFLNTGDTSNDKFQNGVPIELEYDKLASETVPGLDFWIKAGDNEIHVGSNNPIWQTEKVGQTTAPFGIVVEGLWEWPKEWTCIVDAYSSFKDFARSPATYSNWYEQSPASGTTYQMTE